MGKSEIKKLSRMAYYEVNNLGVHQPQQQEHLLFMYEKETRSSQSILHFSGVFLDRSILSLEVNLCLRRGC